jgi:hypothetical protein
MDLRRRGILLVPLRGNMVNHNLTLNMDLPRQISLSTGSLLQINHTMVSRRQINRLMVNHQRVNLYTDSLTRANRHMVSLLPLNYMVNPQQINHNTDSLLPIILQQVDIINMDNLRVNPRLLKLLGKTIMDNLSNRNMVSFKEIIPNLRLVSLRVNLNTDNLRVTKHTRTVNLHMVNRVNLNTCKVDTLRVLPPGMDRISRTDRVLLYRMVKILLRNHMDNLGMDKVMSRERGILVMKWEKSIKDKKFDTVRIYGERR